MYDVQYRKAVINYYYKFINISTNIVKDIHEIFCISIASLYNWIDLYKLNGNLIPKQVGRPMNSGKINDAITKYIIKQYSKDKKPTIKNVRRSIRRIFNVVIKKPTIYNVLHSNKITFKKITKCFSPFSNKEKEHKKQELRNSLHITEENIKKKSFNHDNVISVDESFMSISTLTKEYDWSKKGIRCCKKVNGRRYRQGKSMLLAISNKKVVAYKLNGPVNGEIFYDFLVNDVIKDQSNLNILLDNARIHHYKKTKNKIKGTGNILTYNVAYHPEYNPVEYINNVIKGSLKRDYINDIKKLDDKLKNKIEKIKKLTFENCFNHAYKSISAA